MTPSHNRINPLHRLFMLHVAVTVLVAAPLGAASLATPAAYSETFVTNPPNGWVVASGAWSVSSGIYSNSTTGAHKTIYSVNTWADNYIYRFSVRTNLTGASAQFGCVFNYYNGGNDYYKMYLKGDGGASLRRRVGGGTETEDAVAPAGIWQGFYAGPGNNNPWVEVQITRKLGTTTVHVNGSRVFNAVSQNVLGPGGIGLWDNSTSSSFDNVSVTPIPVVTLDEDFFDNLAQGWTPVSPAGWSVSGNTYNLSTNNFRDITLYSTHTWATNYTYRVTYKSTYAASTNKAGVVYNYIDANNYYEVLLGATGTAEINKVVSGTRTSQGTASYVGGGIGKWHEIAILRSGANTTVNVNGRRVFTNIPQGEHVSGKVGLAGSFNGVAKFDNISITNGLDPYKKTFPKLAGIHISTMDYHLPVNQQKIARRDLAVLGIYKGWARGAIGGETPTQTQTRVVNEIKALNPALLVGNYTNAMETDNSQEPADADFDIFDALNNGLGPVGGASPNNWWAYNASNARVSVYPGKDQANVTFFPRPNASGFRVSQWMAARWATLIYNGPAYDFWYSDNAFTKPRPRVANGVPTPLIDWNRDGVNDSSEDANVSANWRKGMATYFLKAAQLQPGTPLMIPNYDGYDADGSGYARDPEYSGLNGGGLFETAMGRYYANESFSWHNTMLSYAAMMDNTRPPKIVMLNARGLNTGEPESQPSSVAPPKGQNFPAGYAFMRYALASALMEDGYLAWSPPTFDVTQDAWFDEFGQYLGQSVDLPVRTPTWTSGQAAGAYMRKFQNGAAIVNPRRSPPPNPVDRGSVTIDLTGQGYKRFVGTQDPANNGSTVTTITIAAGDGVILVK